MRSFATVALLTILAACVKSTPTVPPENAASSVHGTAAGMSPEVHRQLAALRQTTAPFQSFEKAEEAGYGEKITPCWFHRELGGQGYHYGKPALIDGAVSLLEPELLMYEPQPGGRMRLVGVEYIVPVDQWQGQSPPTLLGRELHPHPVLPLYVLHVWLWRHNPEGMFADWNPTVSCAHAAESEDRAP